MTEQADSSALPTAEKRGWALAHDPAGGSFLGLPGLHQLLGKLSELIRILGGIEGPVELFDLKPLFRAELNAAVYRDLQLRMNASYGLESNDLLQITRLCSPVSTCALAIC